MPRMTNLISCLIIVTQGLLEVYGTPLVHPIDADGMVRIP